MNLVCWLQGHALPVYRIAQDGSRGYVCPRCHAPQALTELPEIARNRVAAEQRAQVSRDAAIVAEREVRVEERRQRDHLRLVTGKRA
jgi:hypothetical protein